MTEFTDEPIRDLIRRPLLQVHLDDTLRQLAEILATESVGAAVVKGTRPPALISERDIINALANGVDPDRTAVREAMTEDLATAAPSDRTTVVAQRMLADEIRHMPIVEDEVVIGVVSVRDVLRAVVDGRPGS